MRVLIVHSCGNIRFDLVYLPLQIIFPEAVFMQWKNVKHLDDALLNSHTHIIVFDLKPDRVARIRKSYTGYIVGMYTTREKSVLDLVSLPVLVSGELPRHKEDSWCYLPCIFTLFKSPANVSRETKNYKVCIIVSNDTLDSRSMVSVAGKLFSSGFTPIGYPLDYRQRSKWYQAQNECTVLMVYAADDIQSFLSSCADCLCVLTDDVDGPGSWISQLVDIPCVDLANRSKIRSLCDPDLCAIYRSKQRKSLFDHRFRLGSMGDIQSLVFGSITTDPRTPQIRQWTGTLVDPEEVESLFSNRVFVSNLYLCKKLYVSSKTIDLVEKHTAELGMQIDLSLM